VSVSGFGRAFSLRQPGAISCWSRVTSSATSRSDRPAMGFLEQAGYAPASLGIAVEKVDLERITHARFVGMAPCRCTPPYASASACRAGPRDESSSHVCFYGLYASLNAE